MEDKGRQGARGDYEDPHGDKVADHAELRIASRGKDAPDDHGIDGPSEYVIDTHQKHIEQIM